ncbi:hypothetical protein [Pseudoalteromonas luteoviolacea]|uniref:hypothetical protein n=1 Tax=Pseudoalteromonas luteoviolacea TaxID=43657 RepID=UPI001B358495|nr:hypothetical protein [Pseudoalteromonas luteoviolacea]MBQ4839314.1 hypothetical protein [Pseudoalteromonas luteoviolacea]
MTSEPLTFSVYACIRRSQATDQLGLPVRHPLYHRHASLVFKNNCDQSSYAYGFGFNGFSREPVPKPEKLLAKEWLYRKLSRQGVERLFIKLNDIDAASYNIATYNCVDHLVVCLQVLGRQSRLFNRYRYLNRRWYGGYTLRRKVL